jgi:CubicO group peptidase (beta-lactamase class C family)
MTEATRCCALLALIAAPLTAALAQPGFPPDNPDSWRVAGTAKVLCSALFVSGRDPTEARGHVAGYFLGPKLDSITEFHVDRERRLVRLTLANRITREAKLYGDQGCVIHQPGKDTVFFTPVRVTSLLPPASRMIWPMGDVYPDNPLPADVDTAKLRQATDAAFANPAGLTAAFVVVHRARIVAERYANGAHKDMQLESWSMGKSITGTLIGVLIQQGALRLEDPAAIPEWRQTPNDPRAKIRIMDLMRMSSGLRFSRGSPEDIPGYHDHDLIYTGAIDAFQFVTTRPLQFEPNTVGRYRNTDPLILGQIIRDVVRKRGEDYLTWPQRALFDKIGIRRQVLETDPYGNFLLSGYDYGTARNWARLGVLYLHDGVWNGERLLPEGFVKFVSTPAPAWRDSSYGGMVWLNARGTWNLPRDAFAFRGAGGQETYVVPSRDLVVVRMGHFPGSRIGRNDLARALALLMEAFPAQTVSALPEVVAAHDLASQYPNRAIQVDSFYAIPDQAPGGRSTQRIPAATIKALVEALGRPVGRGGLLIRFSRPVVEGNTATVSVTVDFPWWRGRLGRERVGYETVRYVLARTAAGWSIRERSQLGIT